MPHLEREDGKLHYEVQGEGETTIVLSHGFGIAGDVWRDVVAELTGEYQVVTYDQRCCGDSDKSFSDVSVSAQGSDLLALCDEVGANSVVLNGWSFGGAVVVDAGAKLGEQLKGLVLTGGASPRYTQADGFPHGGTQTDVAATVEALGADAAAVLDSIYRDAVFVADVNESIKDWCVALASKSSRQGDQALNELAASDQREIMKALTCPALIIHGVDDAVVPFGIGEFASKTLSNATLVAIESCGHAPFLEYPSDYMNYLKSFLKEL